jgi:hypothetical protein
MKNISLTPLIHSLRQSAVHFAVRRAGRRYERKLLAAAANPERAQAEVLQRILARQAATGFGQAHDFSTIAALGDYREKVGVQGYEDLRPWLERQESSGEKTLNAEKLLMYAMTSGTTGKPKFIPIHESSLKAYNGIQKFFLYKLLQRSPEFMSGHVLAIVGSAVEGRMPASGTPFGSTSGHMYEGVSPLVRSKYLVPASVFSIGDHDLKYLTILRLALGCDDLSYLTTANPSTVSRLIHLAQQNWEALMNDLETGTFHGLARLAPAIAADVQKKLQANPTRATELRAAFARRQGKPRLKDLWPNLRAIGCWTGGSCGIFLEQWKRDLPAGAVIQEIGYLSSEFRGTIAIDEHNAGIPTLLEHHFEFVERDDWESGIANFKGLHELQDGREYYLFVTTDTGLYRYDINDIVRVEGFFQRTPRLAFVQKGKGVTNVTGEKLYENQLIAAVRAAEAKLGLSSDFYFGIADEKAAGYRLFYQPSLDQLPSALELRERLTEEVEQELATLNIEYAAKRKSGRLMPLKVAVLSPQAFDDFKAYSVRQGQREGQFKIVALQYLKSVEFPFDSYALSGALS